jgi:hypothetical protein
MIAAPTLKSPSSPIAAAPEAPSFAGLCSRRTFIAGCGRLAAILFAAQTPLASAVPSIGRPTAATTFDLSLPVTLIEQLSCFDVGGRLKRGVDAILSNGDRSEITIGNFDFDVVKALKPALEIYDPTPIPNKNACAQLAGLFNLQIAQETFDALVKDPTIGECIENSFLGSLARGEKDWSQSNDDERQIILKNFISLLRSQWDRYFSDIARLRKFQESIPKDKQGSLSYKFLRLFNEGRGKELLEDPYYKAISGYLDIFERLKDLVTGQIEEDLYETRIELNRFNTAQSKLNQLNIELPDELKGESDALQAQAEEWLNKFNHFLSISSLEKTLQIRSKNEACFVSFVIRCHKDKSEIESGRIIWFEEDKYGAKAVYESDLSYQALSQLYQFVRHLLPKQNKSSEIISYTKRFLKIERGVNGSIKLELVDYPNTF